MAREILTTGVLDVTENKVAASISPCPALPWNQHELMKSPTYSAL
jgi:hypothetical protein